jgi:hypothetical protein
LALSKEIERLLQKIRNSDASVRNIAKKTGISEYRMYNWLNKNIPPKYDDVVKLQQYFGELPNEMNEPPGVYDHGQEVSLRDQIRSINGMLSILAGEVALMKSAQTGEPVGSVLLRLQKAAADAALLG